MPEIVDRENVLAALAIIVPDFDPYQVKAVQITPTRLTADIAATAGQKCWKDGCTRRDIHSHPKTWDVR